MKFDGIYSHSLQTHTDFLEALFHVVHMDIADTLTYIVVHMNFVDALSRDVVRWIGCFLVFQVHDQLEMHHYRRSNHPKQ